MKLSPNLSPVEIGGAVGAPKQFNIAASREAFNILSSGLYNDKILAIIRELSCNSYDAHVAAGKKDQPFEIHLPTNFEPHFTVKDYGVGLSHDEVMALYCTYFGTNKSDSNDFIGALGLGSKSPFCYTEGFTVTSRFNGKTRIYSAYLEDGVPSVVLQSEEDTPGESNGLEVTFPVKRNDIWEFENKARVALEFFDPKPKINIDLNISKQEYSIKSELWGMRSNARTHHTSGLRAIQGMVQYEVGSIDMSRMSSQQYRLSQLPLDLFFPMGDLSVAASRETLSNDERTIGNILKMLDTISKGLVDEVKKQLEACKVEWEAKILLFNLQTKPGIGSFIREAFESGSLDGRYASFTLNHNPASINELDYTATVIHEFKRKYGNEYARKEPLFMNPAQRTAALDRIAGGLAKKENFKVPFEISPSVLFVIGDIAGGEKYIHYFLQRDNILDGVKKDLVYFFSRATKDFGFPKVASDALKMLKDLGNPPYVMLSTLQKKYESILKPIGPAKTYKKVELYWFDQRADIGRHRDGYDRKGWRDGWRPVEKWPLPDGRKFFVTLDKLEPTESGFNFAETFSNFISAVRDSGLFGLTTNDVIYGVPKTSNLSTNRGWTEFTNYVFTELKKIMTPEKELELSLTLKEFQPELMGVMSKIAKENILSPTSPMQIFCEQYEKARSYDMNALDALARVIKVAENRNIYKVKNIVDFKQRWAEIHKIYPLLSCLYSWEARDKADAIGEYIKLIDRDKEGQKPVYTLQGEKVNVN